MARFVGNPIVLVAAIASLIGWNGTSASPRHKTGGTQAAAQGWHPSKRRTQRPAAGSPHSRATEFPPNAANCHPLARILTIELHRAYAAPRSLPTSRPSG